jgi:hypothetical protein
MVAASSGATTAVRAGSDAPDGWWWWVVMLRSVGRSDGVREPSVQAVHGLALHAASSLIHAPSGADLYA